MPLCPLVSLKIAVLSASVKDKVACSGKGYRLFSYNSIGILLHAVGSMHSVHLTIHRQYQLVKRNIMQISFILHRIVYGTQLLIGLTELLSFLIQA